MECDGSGQTLWLAGRSTQPSLATVLDAVHWIMY